MKNLTISNQTQKSKLYSITKQTKNVLSKLNSSKFLLLFVLAFFNSIGNNAQNNITNPNFTGKESIRLYTITTAGNPNCEISKNHQGGCWSTEISSVLANNGKFDIEILVTYIGSSSCKELSHFSIEADNNSFSNVAWSSVSGNPSGNISNSLGNNDPFDGFKLDNVSDIGDGMAGSFKMTYTLNYLQDQQFLAKAGNDYSQIASFSTAEFQQVMNCQTPPCETANNTTASASITESQTKTLTGTPAGGTWSIVSGGGTINGSTYTPDDINTNTTVKIRYTIAANGSCAATTDDVTFTVTPVCTTANNTTASASITESQTKTLTATPAGGTWSIVSGGGTINGTTYTPDDINTNTTVKIRYTIAADGACAATTDDVTFTVTPVCLTADNTTSTATITESETKTLTGTPTGGTWSIIYGGGTINGNTYTPDNINSNTSVKIKYSIPADGDCAWTYDYVIFTVTPVCNVVANNTTSSVSITEGQTKALTGTPAGGTWSIVSVYYTEIG